MTTPVQTNINGVNVDQLVQTVQAIQGNPDLAKFTFRAQTQWINGGHSQTKISLSMARRLRMHPARSRSYWKGMSRRCCWGQIMGPML